VSADEANELLGRMRRVADREDLPRRMHFAIVAPYPFYGGLRPDTGRGLP
jgi:hypothetical protein